MLVLPKPYTRINGVSGIVAGDPLARSPQCADSRYDDRVLTAVRMSSILVCTPVIMPFYTIDEIPILIFAPCIQADFGFPGPIFELFHRRCISAPAIEISDDRGALGLDLFWQDKSDLTDLVV